MKLKGLKISVKVEGEGECLKEYKTEYDKEQPDKHATCFIASEAGKVCLPMSEHDSSWRLK